MDDIKRRVRDLAESYADRGDPTGWFEEYYSWSGGDIAKVHWADRVPSPHLMAWLDERPAPVGKRAVVVGCGLGDDAEALAARGYEVVAFDISATAIDMCRKRYPDSAVEYAVADLFNPPPEWAGAFDLVFECNTIQTFTDDLRFRVRDAVVGLVAPRGVVLVSCRSRKSGEREDEFPLALDRDEIDGFVGAELLEEHFEAYDDEQDPPVPHFFAAYRRP